MRICHFLPAFVYEKNTARKGGGGNTRKIDRDVEKEKGVKQGKKAVNNTKDKPKLQQRSQPERTQSHRYNNNNFIRITNTDRHKQKDSTRLNLCHCIFSPPRLPWPPLSTCPGKPCLGLQIPDSSKTIHAHPTYPARPSDFSQESRLRESERERVSSSASLVYPGLILSGNNDPASSSYSFCSPLSIPYTLYTRVSCQFLDLYSAIAHRDCFVLSSTLHLHCFLSSSIPL